MAAANHILFRDFETRSGARLDLVGAWRYAADPSTEVLCVGYAVDDGPVRIWTPGQAIPEEFIDAARNSDWLVIAHNDQFESAIEQLVLAPRYAWSLVPLERHRCTMAMAMAAALPGALEGAALALGLSYQKDREGRRLMLRLSRASDQEPGAEGLERLFGYCRQDVTIERALYHRLPPLSASEQALWTLDARINQRGFHIDRTLAEAGRQLARKEQAHINTTIAFLTDGTITTANQVEKILKFVQARGHTMKTLNKRSVSAALERSSSEEVRQLLELRREGSRASTRKITALLAGADADDRLRGTLRFHGAATGRWSGSRFQPQNLKKPENKQHIDAAIDAIIAGDDAMLRTLGAPLTLIGDVSRAMICAAPGHRLIGADFSAIESRVLAWIAGEDWKLESYRRFDVSGDPTLEPYCVTASKILKRPVTPDDEAGRQIGKTADLAYGYGGGLGAWRKFDFSDVHSDDDVERFKREWRSAHKATVRFWRVLERAAHRAVRTGLQVSLGKTFSFVMENGTLLLTLPSGRRLAYPEAHIGPGKYDGTTQIVIKDNTRGGWSDNRAWYGSFTENVVSGISRDLLAAAMQRLEAAGYSVVLHVHDEVICEVADDFGSEHEFLRLMTELPDWAERLPLVAKVWSGQRYTKTKAPIETKPQAKSEPPPAIEHVPAEPIAPSAAAPAPEEADEGADVPLTNLIAAPLIGGRVSCPFHDDRSPSCQVYYDHFHCFGCGAHGDRIDWLMAVDGLTRGEALQLLASWTAPLAPATSSADRQLSRSRAIAVWQEGQPIVGTPAARYLAEHRRIDLAGLPANVDEVLRYHPRCPFGPGARHPCLLALMRDIASDEPTGIHRIALTPDANKLDRRMLGRWGAVKLWPAGSQLIVGEGIETVLAAATRLSHRGAPLRPAWSAVSRGGLDKLPVILGVERLIVLVDHDLNGQGQAAAGRCAERWSRAGRHVIQLKPKRPGADFNDIVMERAS